MVQLSCVEVSGSLHKNCLSSFKSAYYWALPSEIWIQQVSEPKSLHLENHRR